LTHSEADWRKSKWGDEGKAAYSRQMDLYLTSLVVVGIALVMVLSLGTFFYRRSKKVFQRILRKIILIFPLQNNVLNKYKHTNQNIFKGNKGRFDISHGPPASYRKTTVRNAATATNYSLANQSNGAGGNILSGQSQQMATMEDALLDADGLESSNAPITTDDSS
jgi:hypothetical protein